ncbi:nmrA-like family domain-containing protein 1 [Aspergillus lentulus]|uniref:NmrA-like family domain-containing protein 1 n=1 Tax=Aspergillus lentulus TaxID=293939 RepID=A0AAN4PCU4_ASPLE|nr:hypothetical protein CNMCM6936_005601 [Aspergillus lentulus]GAQ03953.1 nmrA-like family domain-containing protein 1 [Aspergillus lentulus]GFF97504.1 nmrA-like family domain-containing protein 1 [Aspergillus lentulus]GFG18514.1 nmrA-like family domain-containing protein 1 [Aspergillus lentulus]
MGSIPMLITVFGATGNQGSSVCRSLAKNPEFKVRAITRNPQSDASRQLSTLGVEMVRADGWNSEQMLEAFQGSWGAFINTNSFDPIFLEKNGSTEFDLGRNVVDSAVAAGVPHLVYSSGAPCFEMTRGQIQLDAYDKKWETEQYIRAICKFKTFTAIGAGWYLENFLDKEQSACFGGFPHIEDEEGYLTFRMPEIGESGEVPWVDITHDFGDIVQGIFLDPERWDGAYVQAISEVQSLKGMAEAFEKATGKKTRYAPVLPSWEAFETYGVPELEILKRFIGFMQLTGGYCFQEKSDVTNAAELKRETSRALNSPESILTSLVRFFSDHFPAQTGELEECRREK